MHYTLVSHRKDRQPIVCCKIEIHTVNEALMHGGTDPDSLKSLYNRIYADVPQLPPLENVSPIPSAKIIPFNGIDLKKMDAALKKGGALNG